MVGEGGWTPVNDYPREIGNLYRKSNTEDGRSQKIKSTLDLLVDARPYVRRWHMDGRLKVVQTLDQMDARPDANPEGRSSRCGRSSRRSSRRTLVQKIVEKWTLVHKIGRSSRKLDAPPENWTLVVVYKTKLHK
ncbi:hypothetical protein LR48_Vigan10g119400 [Vigna angularis]|uniref:Uncharacterized protein n=1 Tax=Phaseolus angularis TaxID=3914 RepID=A0A0L9VK64_PHAAN|nr:hypothetical protein LR48_Vigan10g119400 [Vigna angularis]